MKVWAGYKEITTDRAVPWGKRRGQQGWMETALAGAEACG